MKDPQPLEVGDSLEFSVVHNTNVVHENCVANKYGLKAIRVIRLPRDSVKFEHVSDELYTGYVDREPSVHLSAQGDEQTAAAAFGFIRFDTSGKNQQSSRIFFTFKSQCDEIENGNGASVNGSSSSSSGSANGNKPVFYNGDKVQFNILTCLRTNSQYAVNVKLVEPRREIGYITMLKDNYGFIELDLLFDLLSTANRMPKDIFFHYRLKFTGLLNF